MSLDRLINLAKRTGDRLIVHDPVNGRDVVILDIDAYEALVFGRKEVLEDGIFPEDLEESDTSDWHSAGSILSDRYSDWKPDEEEDHAEAGVSLVDDMWKEADLPAQTGPTGEEVKAVLQDAAEERKEIEDTSEPVFYEEPIA